MLVCWKGFCVECRAAFKIARRNERFAEKAQAGAGLPHFMTGVVLGQYNAERTAAGLCSAILPICNEPALPNTDVKTPLCLRHWLIRWACHRIFPEVEQTYKIPQTLKLVQEIETHVLPHMTAQLNKQGGRCYFSGYPIAFGHGCTLHLLREVDGRRPDNIVLIHQSISNITLHRDPEAVLQWAKNFVRSVEVANADAL